MILSVLFHKLLKLFAALGLLVALSACGGGGGGSDASSAPGNSNPNPEGETDPTPVFSASVSGTILVANNSFFDADTPSVRDDFSDLDLNNSTATAQNILNPVTLGGYLSGSSGSYSNGEFFQKDAADVYSVSIEAGQTLTLEVKFADEMDRIQNEDIDLFLSISPRTDPDLRVFSEDIDREIRYEINVDRKDNYLIRLQVADDTRPITYVLSVGQQLGLSSPAQTSRQLAKLSSDFVEDEVIIKFKNSSQATSNQKQFSQTSSFKRSYAADSVALADLMSSLSYKHDIDSSTSVYKRIESNSASASNKSGSPSAANVAQSKQSTLDLIAELNALPEVEYAEPNYVYRSLIINGLDDIQDDFFDEQWNMTMIQTPAAWRVSSGEDVIVAVVDTGINPDHPDLNGNVLFSEGYDFVSTGDNEGDQLPGRDSNPTDEGSDFHGSHVSGIIAAVGNQIGVRGVAYDAQIMPVRALGSDGTGTADDIANAIRYAAGLANDSGQVPFQRADIINLSLGSPDESIAISNAVADAIDAGVFVVAAAGNEAEFGDIRPTSPSFPAATEGVIAVGAVNEARQRSSFSNIGSYIDVAAPGGASSESQFRDNSLDGVLSTFFGRNYEEYVGTSMAAPHVSGVIALMKSADPFLTPTAFNNLLESGELTDNIDDAVFSEVQNRQFFGAGLINASKSLSALGREIPTTVSASPGNLRLSTILEQTSFVLSQTGTGGIVIDSVTPTDDRIILGAPSTDSRLGVYTVSLNYEPNRSLEVFDIIVAYSIDGVPQENIVVELRVVESPENINNLGTSFQVYMTPYDEETRVLDTENARAITPIFDRNRYTYEFENVEPGVYLLSAGTDFDGDSVWDEEGESFGYYFENINSLNPDLIVVTEDGITQQDFNVRY